MKIGIDVSQLAYRNTGVANYLGNLARELIQNDKENDYILFFSSLRRNLPLMLHELSSKKNVKVKRYRFPPLVIDFLWNKLHIMPIELFVGDVDFFITSDWTEPPARRAMKATILYDLIIYKYPEETARRIVETQKRKLHWVKKESDIIFCISESTKNDAHNLLGIDKSKLKVVYPSVE